MAFKTSFKIRLARRKHYQKNKERNKLYTREYRRKNPNKIKAYNQEYREKNKTYFIKKSTEYRSKNKEKIRLNKKNWDKKNKIHKKKYKKKWYLKNKERIITLHKTRKYRAIAKKVRIKRKEKDRVWRKEYQKRPKSIMLRKKRAKLYAPILKKRVAKRKKTDVNFKLRLALSKRVLVAVKFAKTKKAFKTQKLIGCSIKTMRKHLEKKFKKGMTWHNHGRHGWHIDHKRALEKFDLSDPKQQLIAFNYKNCQPLWWWENLEKGMN